MSAPDDLLLRVGHEISAAMKRHRLSHVTIAQRAQVSPTTVWRVLNMHDGRLSTLAKLAEAADCDIEIRLTPKPPQYIG